MAFVVDRHFNNTIKTTFVAKGECLNGEFFVYNIGAFGSIGSLHHKLTMTDGYITGPYTVYKSNGAVLETGDLVKCLKNGTVLHNCEGGEYKLTCYIDGERYGESLWYTSDDKIKVRTQYVNDKRIEETTYDEQGREKKYVSYPIDGTSPIGRNTTYDENNHLKSIHHTKNDWRHGAFMEFHDDFIKTGSYTCGKYNGFIHKIYRGIYHPLEKKTQYKLGKKFGVKEVTLGGVSMRYTTYRNNIKHGLQREMHARNIPKSIVSFHNGKKHGEERKWDNTGKLKSVVRYSHGLEVY